jgi:hypothetical protein
VSESRGRRGHDGPLTTPAMGTLVSGRQTVCHAAPTKLIVLGVIECANYGRANRPSEQLRSPTMCDQPMICSTIRTIVTARSMWHGRPAFVDAVFVSPVLPCRPVGTLRASVVGVEAGSSAARPALALARWLRRSRGRGRAGQRPRAAGMRAPGRHRPRPRRPPARPLRDRRAAAPATARATGGPC